MTITQRPSWRLALAIGLTGSAYACTAQYPRGAIVCTSEPNDCPDGMSCRIVGDADEGRCFPGVGSTSGEHGSVDAATDAADTAVPDASHNELVDAGKADAGGRPAPGGAGGAGGKAGKAGAGGRVASGGAGAAGEAVSGGAGGTAGQSMPAAGSGSAGEPQPIDPCEDPARECDAADVDSDEGECGSCNTGTRTRTRQCNPSTCRWQAWSAWSSCAADPTKCTPGTSEPRTVDCPHCGSKRQTRTCSTTTCTFTAWTDASACSWCEECAKVEWCETPDDVAKNRGTWCWPQNGCNDDQAWGRCQEILKDLGCQVHQPVYTGH